MPRNGFDNGIGIVYLDLCPNLERRKHQPRDWLVIMGDGSSFESLVPRDFINSPWRDRGEFLKIPSGGRQSPASRLGFPV